LEGLIEKEIHANNQFADEQAISAGGQSLQECKQVVLSCLFTTVSFVNSNGQIKFVRRSEITRISNLVSINESLVQKIVSRFLIDLFYLRRAVHFYKDTVSFRNIDRRSKTYLRKLYRIAPVFDFRRTKTNLALVTIKLKKLNVYLSATTRVAAAIYVTDKKQPLLGSNRFIKTNFRCFCSCSAYALHQVRHRLSL